MSKSTGELVSVKIIPERARRSRREACRCGGGLRSRSRPAQRDETDWLRSVGTSRWREKRDVSGPAVLRERGTPELRTAATRQRGAECAGGDQAVHPRRVQPRPGSRLIGQRSPRRCGLSPAAWGHRCLRGLEELNGMMSAGLRSAFVKGRSHGDRDARCRPTGRFGVGDLDARPRGGAHALRDRKLPAVGGRQEGVAARGRRRPRRPADHTAGASQPPAPRVSWTSKALRG